MNTSLQLCSSTLPLKKKKKMFFLLQAAEIQKEKNKLRLQPLNQRECKKAIFVSMIQI